MKVRVAALAFVSLLLLFGCTQGGTNGLTMGEAKAIAQKSDCMGEGPLKGSYSYNNNSKTWWFDIDAQKEGCSPACVVYEANKSAEVNWRCTGLLPSEPALKTYAHPELGQILVDKDGMALYVYLKDEKWNSTCYGECESSWPPLIISGESELPSGLPGTAGYLVRRDSRKQATYNGMPLYSSSMDSKTNDIKGQGYRSLWYVATPSMKDFPTPSMD